MDHHDREADDDDALARRLRRAAARFAPHMPADLPQRTLMTVQRDRVLLHRWWQRSQVWRPLLAATLLAAVTLGLVLATTVPRSEPTDRMLRVQLPQLPWQALADLPLDQEWRSLQADAGRAAQVLVACLPTRPDRLDTDRR